jgi:transposase
MKLFFLPPLSSTLNPIERAWAILKSIHKKNLANVTHKLRDEEFDIFCECNITELSQRLKPSILNAAGKYMERSIRGLLV